MSSSFTVDLKSVDGGGSFVGLASAPTTDRDNEVIEAFSLRPLPPLVVVKAGHDLGVDRPERIIGTATPKYDQQGRLILEGKFAGTELAQTIRRLARDVRLGLSIVFRALQRKGNRIVKGELLGVDVVSIPSHPQAAILSVKSLNLAGSAADGGGQVKTSYDWGSGRIGEDPPPWSPDLPRVDNKMPDTLAILGYQGLDPERT